MRRCIDLRRLSRNEEGIRKDLNTRWERVFKRVRKLEWSRHACWEDKCQIANAKEAGNATPTKSSIYYVYARPRYSLSASLPRGRKNPKDATKRRRKHRHSARYVAPPSQTKPWPLGSQMSKASGNLRSRLYYPSIRVS